MPRYSVSYKLRKLLAQYFSSIYFILATAAQLLLSVEYILPLFQSHFSICIVKETAWKVRANKGAQTEFALIKAFVCLCSYVVGGGAALPEPTSETRWQLHFSQLLQLLQRLWWVSTNDRIVIYESYITSVYSNSPISIAFTQTNGSR